MDVARLCIAAGAHVGYGTVQRALRLGPGGYSLARTLLRGAPRYTNVTFSAGKAFWRRLRKSSITVHSIPNLYPALTCFKVRMLTDPYKNHCNIPALVWWHIVSFVPRHWF